MSERKPGERVPDIEPSPELAAARAEVERLRGAVVDAFGRLSVVTCNCWECKQWKAVHEILQGAIAAPAQPAAGERNWTVKEQVVEDQATGLTFQFEVIPQDQDAPFRLRIFGNLEFGNREILFSRDGMKCGAGTSLTAGPHKPTWLQPTQGDEDADRSRVVSELPRQGNDSNFTTPGGSVVPELQRDGNGSSERPQPGHEKAKATPEKAKATPEALTPAPADAQGEPATAEWSLKKKAWVVVVGRDVVANFGGRKLDAASYAAFLNGTSTLHTELAALPSRVEVMHRAAAAWEAVVKYRITVGWELTEWSAMVAQPPLVGVGPTPIEAVEALVTKLKGK